MTDAIDRQAAIDEIRKCRFVVDAIEKIRGLPSAQPELTKINIEDFNKEDWERLKKEWGNTPITVLSAQPEQIRCKDCKHRPIATRADEGVLWGFSVEFPDERCPLQCEDGWYNHYPKDDFYCANAERRTDEAD